MLGQKYRRHVLDHFLPTCLRNRVALPICLGLQDVAHQDIEGLAACQRRNECPLQHAIRVGGMSVKEIEYLEQRLPMASCWSLGLPMIKSLPRGSKGIRYVWVTGTTEKVVETR